MGEYTPKLELYQPSNGEKGWGTLVNENFDKIANSCAYGNPLPSIDGEVNAVQIEGYSSSTPTTTQFPSAENGDSVLVNKTTLYTLTSGSFAENGTLESEMVQDGNNLTFIGGAYQKLTHPTPTKTYPTITTITKTLTLTTNWQNTGIAGSNLTSGSYVVQISGIDYSVSSIYWEVYTGFMTWFSGGTNGNSGNYTDTWDIPLHAAGHARNDRVISLRTLAHPNSDSSPYCQLQIKCTTAFSGASSITFKFCKII